MTESPRRLSPKGNLDVFENLLRQISAQHKKDIEIARTACDAELPEVRVQPKEFRVHSQWNDPISVSSSSRKLASIPDDRRASDDLENSENLASDPVSDGLTMGATVSMFGSSNIAQWVSTGVNGMKDLFGKKGPSAATGSIPTLKMDNRLLWSQVTQKIQNDRSHHHGHLMLHFVNAKGWMRSGKSSNKITTRMQHLVDSQTFDAFSAIGILLNSALLGARINYSAQHRQLNNLPAFYNVGNYVFTTWFLLELILRWTSVGFISFFFVKGWRWNMFDAIVVGTDLVVTFMEIIVGDQEELANLTIMRTLRVLRTARALRAVRLVSFCKELRMMVLSILTSGMSLIWSMVLLFIIIFVFGIYLMQGVTQGLKRGDGDAEGKLEEYFGSLIRTLYTLFTTVSGGISWREVCDPLIELHWTNGVVMSFFIFFTIFAMLNIITGIFVQTAISSVQHDDDEVIQEEVGSTDSLIEKLGRVFEDADTEGLGVITMAQFESILADHRTGALMAGLGLDISEASSMFRLMDLDLSGNISLEEFLVGCMRMRGNAKSVDMVSLLYENKKLAARWTAFEFFVMTEFRQIHTLEKNVKVILQMIQGQMPSTQRHGFADVSELSAEAGPPAIDTRPYVNSKRGAPWTPRSD